MWIYRGIVIGLMALVGSSCSKKEIELAPKPAKLSITLKGEEKAEYDFGVLESGKVAALSLTITNLGEAEASALELTGLTAPFVGEKGSCKEALAPNESCVFQIAYNPKAAAYTKVNDLGSVSVSYKGGEKDVSSVVFALKGTANYCSVQESSSELSNALGTADMAYESSTSQTAQSFTSSKDIKLTEISLSLYKGSSASFEKINLLLREDNGNKPASENLSSVIIEGTLVGTSASSVAFKFSSPVELKADTKYWFILDPGTNGIVNGSLNTYLYVKGAFTNNSSLGSVTIGVDGSSSWNNWDYDLNFAMKTCAATAI